MWDVPQLSQLQSRKVSVKQYIKSEMFFLRDENKEPEVSTM